MSDARPPGIPLILGQDPAPDYDWFGRLDYSWFDNSGSLASIPFFETVPEQLDELLETSAKQQQLRLSFNPGECLTESGLQNCADACSNPSSLFRHTNLRACTVLASAALLVQNETYSIDRSDAETAQVMEAWQIPDLSTFNATGVLTHVVRCIPESCTIARLGRCSDVVQSLADVEVRVDNLGIISSRLGQYCNGATLEINADIAGPGVLISYFLQASLAISLYLLLRISTTFARRLGILFSPGGDKGISTHHRSSKLAPLASKPKISRLGAAATSSLVEFQEVQSYFIVSVQIATLISYNPEITDTAGANNTSFAAVILNSGIAAFLNITGVACIVLVQCCLQRAHMRWWYTFIMTSVTLIIALFIFAWRNNLMPPTDGLWETFRDKGPIPLCGNNPSPMVYCRAPWDTRFLDNAIAGYVTCGLSGLAWAGLLIDQLAFTIPERFPAFAKRLQKLEVKRLLEGKRKAWRLLASAYWFIIEALLLLNVGYQLSQLALMVNDIGIGANGSWTFGQLIAVTVWAPTIAKFIYFNIFGVKEGFEERIAKTWQIIPSDEENETNDASALPSRRSSHVATDGLITGETMDATQHRSAYQTY